MQFNLKQKPGMIIMEEGMKRQTTYENSDSEKVPKMSTFSLH
jgi:hypothetical protein